MRAAARARRLRGAARARVTKRRRRSDTSGRSAPTRSACRPCPRRSSARHMGHRGARHLVHHEHGGRRAAAAARSRGGDGDGAARRADSSSRCWRASLSDSDHSRLSVALVDVNEGTRGGVPRARAHIRGAARCARATAAPRRSATRRCRCGSTSVRHWATAAAAERCHARRRGAGGDDEAVSDRARHARRQRRAARRSAAPAARRSARAASEADRRTGFDRRDHGRRAAPKATGAAATIAGSGPRRLRDRPGDVDLVGAARRAREHADAAFSHFKVGAALETADGTVITGCNIENATYGLTICAERVAMFKALSEGHRAFTRIADRRRHRRADAAVRRLPPDPLGVRRQPRGPARESHRKTKARISSKDLLPLPFDARLL